MIMMIMMIYHDHHHHHDEGFPSQRPGGKQEDDPPPISGKKPNPLSVDPSAVDMRGNLFSPLPNSIRGARDDRCWWEAFQGVGEGVNTVTRASKEGKALINSCVCCYSCVRCTAQLSVRDTKAPNEGSSRSDLPLLRASVFFFSEDGL